MLVLAAARTLFYAPRYTVTNQRAVLEEAVWLLRLDAYQEVYKVLEEAVAKLAFFRLPGSTVAVGLSEREQVVSLSFSSLLCQAAYHQKAEWQQEQKAYMLKASVLADHW